MEFWWKGRAIAMRHAGAISDNNYTSSGKVSVYEHISIYIHVCTRAGEERRKWRDLKAEVEANQKHTAPTFSEREWRRMPCRMYRLLSLSLSLLPYLYAIVGLGVSDLNRTLSPTPVTYVRQRAYPDVAGLSLEIGVIECVACYF